MDVRCSQCHTAFSMADGAEHGVCPTCKAEAGLEPIKAVPGPMRAFGTLLGLVLVGALTGDVISRVAG